MNKKNASIAATLVVVIGVGSWLTDGWDLLPRQDSGQETGTTSDIKLVGQVERFQLATTATQKTDVSWFDMAGEKVSLSDFEGRIVLINFWATWCAPCLQELPGVNRLQAKLASNDFTVVAINIDRDGKNKAPITAKKLGLDALDLYIDERSMSARKFGVRGMPTTVLLDRKGRLIGRFEGGAEWDQPESVALLQYFIDHPDYLDGLPKGSG